MKKLLHFIAFTNLYVSLGAAALSAYIMLWNSESINLKVLGFTFSATLFAYNFQRKIGESHQANFLSKQDQWAKGKKHLINFIILLSFTACFYFFSQIPKKSLWLILLLAILSLLYVLEIKSFPGLRKLPFIKVFVVGFVWGGATVLFPSSVSHLGWNPFDWPIQLMTVSLATFVFGESLPFDIRDLRLDNRSKLKTIPAKLGAKKTKLVAYLALILSFLLHLILFLTKMLPLPFLISFGLATITAFLIISRASFKKDALYYSLGLESVLLLPLLFLLIFQTLQAWITL
ncbi:MAG: UbiA family prenyltransferase [Vicingaceae bacterium]